MKELVNCLEPPGMIRGKNTLQTVCPAVPVALSVQPVPVSS